MIHKSSYLNRATSHFFIVELEKREEDSADFTTLFDFYIQAKCNLVLPKSQRQEAKEEADMFAAIKRFMRIALEDHEVEIDDCFSKEYVITISSIRKHFGDMKLLEEPNKVYIVEYVGGEIRFFNNKGEELC